MKEHFDTYLGRCLANRSANRLVDALKREAEDPIHLVECKYRKWVNVRAIEREGMRENHINSLVDDLQSKFASAEDLIRQIGRRVGPLRCIVFNEKVFPIVLSELFDKMMELGIEEWKPCTTPLLKQVLEKMGVEH